MDLQSIKNSKYLSEKGNRSGKQVFLYVGDFLHKDSGPSSRKLKTNDDGSGLDFGTSWSTSGEALLIWLQNDFANNLWTPKDADVMVVMKQFG